MNSRPNSDNQWSGTRVINNSVVFVSGLLDLDQNGIVKNRGDITAQASGIVAEMKVCLERAETRLSDLVKLVVYYVQDDVDEMQFRLHLGRCLGPGVQTAVTFVPLRQLRQTGALVEVEAIAIRRGSAREIVVLDELATPGPGFCHGLRCGEMSFLSGQCAVSQDNSVLYPGDLVSQNQQSIENLQAVLQKLGIDNKDIVKVNSWRAPAPDKAAYEQAATDRFRFLAAAAPAVTGITIPLLDTIGQQIRLDLWAMDSALPRTRINPPNHWGWKLATSYSHGLQVGKWLFVGGQAALDQACVVLHPEDTLAQIDVTLRFIENVLRYAEGEHNIVKLNGLYCPSGDPNFRQQILTSLQDLFRDDQPINTFVPVDHLAYPQQAIEIDAVAIRREP